MTFYDSFFPSYDYNPYQQSAYGRRSQPTRGMNPYASMYQQPSYVNDPYQRVPKQQSRNFPHQQKPRNPYGYPTYYQEESEEEEQEEPLQFQNSHLNKRSQQSRCPDPVPVQQRGNTTMRDSDGINIPIRRAQPNPADSQSNPQKQKKGQTQPQAKQQSYPKTTEKKSNNTDKVAVDRSVLEHKEEDPLIIELPIDRISSSPSSYESNVSYEPGKFEYIWEDEDNDDVIETIIDSPLSVCHPSEEILLACSPHEEMIAQETDEEIDESNVESEVSSTSEEVEMWKKELETLSFIGFDDVNILLPLLREHIHHPNVESEAKQRGLQEILRRLIPH